MKQMRGGRRIQWAGRCSQLRDIAYATSIDIRFAAGAVACLKINFSTLGHPNLQSPRATLPPPNQRQNCSPPPIRAEQWGGTKGKDQGRLRSRPSAAAAIALV